MHDTWSTRTPEQLQAWIWDRCIPEPNSGCWIWLGSVCARTGYGVISKLNAPTTRAHRLSFIAYKGPIPAGEDVHHRCKNKACCNPGHLEAAEHDGHQALHRGKRGPHGRLDPRLRAANQRHYAYRIAKLTEQAIEWVREHWPTTPDAVVAHLREQNAFPKGGNMMNPITLGGRAFPGRVAAAILTEFAPSVPIRQPEAKAPRPPKARPPRTHCKRGHLMAGANVMRVGASRKCRSCHRIAKRRLRAATAEAMEPFLLAPGSPRPRLVGARPLRKGEGFQAIARRPVAAMSEGCTGGGCR